MPLRRGECKQNSLEAQKKKDLGETIKTMITADIDRYDRSFVQLRSVEEVASMTYPNVSLDQYPQFQIIEGDNEKSTR